MISKCANPDCPEQFRYLHQGKLFHLTPTPDVQAATGSGFEFMYERFWLCERCCKEMTLVWGGTQVELVPLPADPITPSAVVSGKVVARRLRRRAAHAGFDSG